jgi:hypothetical protein
MVLYDITVLYFEGTHCRPEQIENVKKRFGISNVVIVGDQAMPNGTLIGERTQAGMAGKATTNPDPVTKASTPGCRRTSISL